MAEQDKVLSTDELMRQMELDEFEGATKVSPRDYGKLRGIAPQLVYYHIREGHITWTHCECGRRVILIKEADEYFKKGEFSEGQDATHTE
jgi:RecA-family ATPase